MTHRVRVAVTGAAGQIGYALLFRIAAGEMFGTTTEIDLHLLELEAALSSLEGVVMELEDAAFPLLKSIVYTSSLEKAMDGVNWAILVGSMPRREGMERSDLLKINGGIFKAQGEALNRFAAKDVHVFVVGNPCNTNCLITIHHAKDIPSERFYAMTSLDELRARSMLAKKALVDVTAVSQMIIWGNHSSTQFPDFYHAKIHGTPVPTVIHDENWLKNTFVPAVQQRGALVIKKRGASSAASAANAALYGVRHLLTDTKVGESFSTCCVSKGEYGVDPGLVFSFPCRYGSGQVKIVEGLSFNTDFAQASFEKTLNELRQEKQAITALNLI